MEELYSSIKSICQSLDEIEKALKWEDDLHIKEIFKYNLATYALYIASLTTLTKQEIELISGISQYCKVTNDNISKYITNDYQDKTPLIFEILARVDNIFMKDHEPICEIAIDLYKLTTATLIQISPECSDEKIQRMNDYLKKINQYLNKEVFYRVNNLRR